MKVILTSDTHYGLDGKTHSKHEKFWRKVARSIKENDVKCLIWAGDLSSNKQRQLRRTLQHMREHIKIPVVVVRGNHDFWDAADKESKEAGNRQWAILDYSHKNMFSEFDIVHLEDGPFVIDDVIICGWDGWYGTTNPPSNDSLFMFNNVEGCPMHTFMSNRAWKQFDEVLSTDTEKYRATIAVTHFNPYCTESKWETMCANLKFYDLIKEKFDVFCCGHNHQFKDRVEDGCRVLNSGSDYNNPKFLLFEV